MDKKIGLVVLASLILLSLDLAEAQQTRKVARIGFLDNSTASGSAILVEAFRQELSKLGWIEGKNITIEYRFSDGKPERLPELVAELLRLKIDVVVTRGVPPNLAAKNATTTIPIVMAVSADPVGESLVTSLARPGGNVTGNSGLLPELNTKRLDILKDAVPKLTRVGLLHGPGDYLAGALQLKELRAAALALKLRLEEIKPNPMPKVLRAPLKPQSRGRLMRL